MNKKIEQEYIEYYKEMAKTNYYPGVSLSPYVNDISSLVEKTNSKSMLDFGCGGGRQYNVEKLHENWGFMPTLYDPAVERYSLKPEGPFDCVISTDVFEHIPEEALIYSLEYIFNIAEKFVFIAISTAKACTILPNGENAHCTVKPLEWWAETINSYNKNKVLCVVKSSKTQEVVFYS